MYRIRQCLLAVQRKIHVEQQTVRSLSSKKSKKKGDKIQTKDTKAEESAKGGHKVRAFDFQHLMTQLENLGRPIEQTKTEPSTSGENKHKFEGRRKESHYDLDKIAQAIFEKKQKSTQPRQSGPQKNSADVDDALHEVATSEAKRQKPGQRRQSKPQMNFADLDAIHDVVASEPDLFKRSVGYNLESGRDERGGRMGGFRSELSTDPVIMRLFGRLPPSRDLLEGIKPLNIFNPSKWNERPEAETVKVSELWKKRFTIDESMIYPKNGFDEMIEWTKQGQMWQYPIDNDQGADTTETFADHVFLDQHLVDFPDDEAVTAFMELICIGLSKNPWLTVNEKVAHIDWFRDYFHENIEELS